MVIAYVDDDLDDKEIFEQALKDIDASIHFIYFTHCHHFIQFIKHNHSSIDYAFIELNIPLMSGLACTENVKSNTSISVVLCSSTISPGSTALAEEMNVPFFLKPPSISELSEEIKKVIFPISAKHQNIFMRVACCREELARCKQKKTRFTGGPSTIEFNL